MKTTDKKKRKPELAGVEPGRDAGSAEPGALARRRIAVAVQLGFAIAAGTAVAPPARAQVITCPITGTLNLNSYALLSSGCYNNGVVNVNSGGKLYNHDFLFNIGAVFVNSGGLLLSDIRLINFHGLTNNAGGTLTNNNYLLNFPYGGTITNSGTMNSYFLVNSDTVINAAGGTLTNGGNLRNGGYSSRSGVQPTLTNDGTLTNNGFLGNFSGATLTNNGTLTNNHLLTGFPPVSGLLANYSGATLANNGLLFNNPGATLANGGTLNNYNYLRNSGTLANQAGGTLVNSGAPSKLINGAGATLTNSGALSNGGLLNNYGSLTNGAGATLGNGGTLNNSNYLGNLSGASFINSGSLNNGAGATLTNSGTLTNTGTLSNQGTLTNSGQLTVTGTGVLSGAGTIAQSAGVLQVDGVLTQSGVTIAGGTLRGAGTINAPVSNSGTLLPGAPGVPGTLSVVGSLVQNPSASLAVDVTPTQASKVAVTGPATLAGTVQVTASAGAFDAPATHTILSASGGVSGTFGALSSSSAFLNATLSYDPNDVFLSLSRAPFCSVASTPNQNSICGALDRTQASGGGTADMQSVLGVLSGLSAAEARAAFDSLDGSVLNAGFKGQVGLADGFTGAIGSRLDTGSAGGVIGLSTRTAVQLAAADGLSDASPAYAQAAAGPADDPRADGNGMWVRASGNSGKTGGDANAGGYRQDGGGLTVGADTEIDRRWRAGGAVNAGTQHVRGDSGSGSGNVDGVSVAAYAQYADGPVRIRGIAGAGRNDNDGTRAVSFGAEVRAASSSFKSNQQFVYTEAAYTMAGTRFDVQPVAALGYTRVENPAYTETGAGALDLAVDAQTRASIRSYVGIRTIHKLDAGGAELRLEPRMLWSHEFGDVDNALASAQLAGSPAAAFQVQGPAIKRDGVVLGAGLSGWVRRDLSVFGDAGAELRSGQSNVTFFLGARYAW